MGWVQKPKGLHIVWVGWHGEILNMNHSASPWPLFSCTVTSLRDAHDRYYKLSVHPVDGGDTREVGWSWEFWKHPLGRWKYYGRNGWWVSYLRIQNHGWRMAKRRKETWLLRWFLKFLIFWFLEWDPFRCSYRAGEMVLANELQASSFPMNKKWNVVDAFLVGFHLGKAFAAGAFAVHRWMFPWSTTTLAAWLGWCAPYPTSHWMLFYVLVLLVIFQFFSQWLSECFMF